MYRAGAYGRTIGSGSVKSEVCFMDETMENAGLDLPQEQYEPVLSQAVGMNLLEAEFTISALDIDGDHVFKTCYGDICKTVNALRDYSCLLEMVCSTWKLEGFHQAKYMYQAEKMREIADKFQAGIGYNYDKAMEKCRKKRGRQQRNSDVGGEAMAMAYLKAQRSASKGPEGGPNPSRGTPSTGPKQEDMSMRARQVTDYDISGDSVITFWVEISNFPQAILDKAKEIDGDWYDSRYFGVCVNYSYKTRRFYIVTEPEAHEAPPGNVYYLGSDDEQHWLTAEMTPEFLERVFLACAHAVENENCRFKPTEQDACQSAAWEMDSEEESI